MRVDIADGKRNVMRLGELETEVMGVMWRARTPMKVRDVVEVLPGTKVLAYTTVMTVLDNLHLKHMVTRAREGRAYAYRPAISREQHSANLIEAAAGGLGQRTGALLNFIDRLTPREVDDLRDALTSRADSSSGNQP